MGGPNCYPLQDLNLTLKDAGLIAASAACQVGGVDKILSLGLGYPSTDITDTGASWEGDIHIYVTAVEVGTGDERFAVEWQLSTSATFASGIVVAAVMPLGAAAVTGSSADSGIGHYILCANNWAFNPESGLRYPYGRLFTRVSGTIASGINFSAFVGEDLD